MAIFSKILWVIIMLGLSLAAACGNGGSYGPQATTPAYNTPYYPTEFPEQDPEFWRRWEDTQGGGG